jgi:hypothetical protein
MGVTGVDVLAFACQALRPQTLLILCALLSGVSCGGEVRDTADAAFVDKTSSTGGTSGLSSSSGGSLGSSASSSSGVGPAPGDAGTSSKTPGPCSSTCNGCCDANGACHPGNTNIWCGFGGQFCAECTGSGVACNDGGSCATVGALGSSGGSGSSSSSSSGGAACKVASCNACPPLTNPCCGSNGACTCTATAGTCP